MNKKTHPLLMSAIAAALLLSQQSAFADDKVYRDYEFNLADINEVEITGNVGSIRILPAAGDQMSVELEIEGNRNGWFKRTRDVSDIELVSKIRGDRLRIEQTEKNTQTDWTIRLPKVEHTDIHLGVGQLDAELLATELYIELGVGDINVDYPKDAAGFIDLNAGVGDANISGMREVESRRAFVSQDVSAEGAGSHDIRMRIGVGDIDLRLK